MVVRVLTGLSAVKEVTSLLLRRRMMVLTGM